MGRRTRFDVLDTIRLLALFVGSPVSTPTDSRRNVILQQLLTPGADVELSCVAINWPLDFTCL